MKVTLMIKRPNGEVEVVDVSEKFPRGLTSSMFDQIVLATRSARRGEVLSFSVENDPLTESEIKKLAEQKKRSDWFKKHGFTEKNF